MADVTMPDGSPFPFWDDTTKYTKTYHVAQQHSSASDENDGTEEKPFATIGHAAAVLQPGEKAVIHEGIYRECVRPACGGQGPDRMIAYEAADGETVVVRGSEAWTPKFVPSEGWNTRRAESYQVWMADLPVEWFVGYNPFMATNLSDEYTTFGIPFSPDETVSMQMRRGLVFLDGKSLKQVHFPGHLAKADGTYWVEDPGLRLHLRLPGDEDPNGRTLEITTREQIFVPAARYQGYIRVSGLQFEFCANGVPIPQRGMVSAWRGHHWIIENCTIRGANALGLDLGNESSHGPKWPPSGEKGCHIVRGNHLVDCGVCGMAGVGGVDHSLIENNLIEDIGRREVERGWESGGIKFHVSEGILIRNNVIRNTWHAPGLWLDWLLSNCRVTGNVFTDIHSVSGGIYVEACKDTNMVDHNIVWGVHKYDSPTSLPFQGPGINVDAGEKCVIANNLVGNITDCYGILVHLTQKDRLVRDKYGLCRKHRILNNILIQCPKRVFLGRKMDNDVDGNVYDNRDSRASHCVEFPSPTAVLNFAAWQEYYECDANGAELKIDAALDGDVLSVNVDGELPAPRPVPELHAAPDHVGPRPLSPGKNDLTLGQNGS